MEAKCKACGKRAIKYVEFDGGDHGFYCLDHCNWFIRFHIDDGTHVWVHPILKLGIKEV